MADTEFRDERFPGLPNDLFVLDLTKQPDRGCATIFARFTDDEPLKERLEKRIREIEEKVNK